MMLSKMIKINSRFHRSIRIDSDIGDLGVLESYICPQSSVEILLNMANGRIHSNEAAFTWTGPYGSGKSSLVIALNALIGKDINLRKIICKTIESNDVKTIQKSFGVTATCGWDFLPVVGFKGDFETALRQIITKRYKLSAKQKKLDTVDLIEDIAIKLNCNLFITVDEMGKFLEAASEGTCDAYFFQQLAERAARSKGKILFLGILHQAFSEYGRRLTRDIRDEWSKIQGRFIDLPLNVAGEELIELVGRAIQTHLKPRNTTQICKSVTEHISNRRPVKKNVLADSLTQCWPLHPVTAALLGPISRRRFSQNQRSVFGFLNSSEQFGFQNFLKTTSMFGKKLFTPDLLWDYLHYNLEPSIMASPDGHRWSIAVNALTRTEAYGADNATISIVKCIALIDMFHERSGLVPEITLLANCVLNIEKNHLINILQQLEDQSILLFKKHKNCYSLYEGSDFDIDAAIEEACYHIPQLDFDQIRKVASFQPIVAKKHYHLFGALRWMDVDLVTSENAIQRAEQYKPAHGAMGLFMIVLGNETEQSDVLDALCRKIASKQVQWPVITSIAKNTSFIRSHARELQALEWIKSNNPSLGGDTVARREVESRLSNMRDRLTEYLHQALANAKWFVDDYTQVYLNFKELHQLASKIAGRLYKYSPKINSELANRIKPSSNSNAALKLLLKAMVKNIGQFRLSIEGYPAEGGLYDILLSNTNLYDGKTFSVPDINDDSCNIAPIWEVADNYFKNNDNRPVSLVEVYEIWIAPPYGIKKGILPFFAVAYIMTRFNDYAAYLENIYRPTIDDLFIDVLMKSPSDIALRTMNFSDIGKQILAGVCDSLNIISNHKLSLSDASGPLEIARTLVALVISLPSWVLRTQKLSKNAIRLRELIKNASDPNKILFDDLPYLFSEHESELSKGNIQPIIEEFKTSLEEMVLAYPNLIDEIQILLFDELQISTDTLSKYKEMNLRAKNIMHVSGDFKLDAFAARLANFSGSNEDVEGVASLAADKPIKDWIDLDVNRAKLRITELSQQFNHNEAFGRVNNRAEHRQAVAFMVGLSGKPKTYVKEFTIKKEQHSEIGQIEALIRNALNGEIKDKPDLLLAALANIGAEVLETNAKQLDNIVQQKVIK